MDFAISRALQLLAGRHRRRTALLAVAAWSCICAVPVSARQELTPLWQELGADTRLEPGEDPAALWEAGSAHYRAKNWQDAIHCFEILQRQFPSSTEACDCAMFLGEARMQVQEHAEALDDFQRLLETNPSPAVASRARFRAAECLLVSGRSDEARAAFESWTADFPEDELNEYALPWLAELHFGQGEYDKARLRYEQMIGRYPDSQWIDRCRLGLGQCLQRLGKPLEADRWYLFTGSRTGNSLADDALMMSARMWGASGDWEQCEKALAKLRERCPGSVLMGEADYLSARGCMARRDWHAAWAFLKAREQEPWPAEIAAQAKLDIALVALRVGETEIARITFEEYCGTGQSTEYSLALGIEIATAVEDLAWAESQLEKLLAAYPDSSLAGRSLEILASAQYQAGHYEQAADHYGLLAEHYVAEEDGSGAGSRAGRIRSCLYFQGLSLIESGKFDEACVVLSRAAAVGEAPELEGPIALALATSLSAGQSHSEAIPHFRKYLELMPDGIERSRCHAGLVRALVRNSQLDQAVSALKAGLASHPGDERVLEACAEVASAALDAGQIELAREFYTQMSKAPFPSIASAGASGLLWCGDDRAALENLETPLKENGTIVPAEDALIAAAHRNFSELDFATAAKLYEQVLAGASESSHAARCRVRLAISLLRMERADDRARALQLLRETVKQAIDPDARELALYELAWAEQADGNASIARDHFLALVDEFSGSKFANDSLYRAAALSRQLGELDRAMELFEQLLATSPDDHLVPYARQGMGEICVDRREWEKAIPLFEKVQQTASDKRLAIPAIYWVAECHYLQSQMDLAERQFGSLLAREVDDPSLASAILLRYSQCLAHRDDWEAVAATLEKAGPSIARGFQFDYLRGKAFLAQGRFDRAREQFRNVLVDPAAKGSETAAMAQWMIGDSFFQEGSWEVAMHAWLLVHQNHLFPQWQARALLQVARCQTQMGRGDLAESTLQTMLTSFPDSTAAVEGRQYLMTLRRATANQSSAAGSSIRLMK